MDDARIVLDAVGSEETKDLVVGSPIRFSDRGAHSLRCIPGEWRLVEVAGLS